MKFALLYCLLFFMCLSLGYPTLNRYDASHRDPDTVQYHEMVMHGSHSAPEHFAHRVVIPYLARGFYELVRNHIGSWDAGYFGLLIANSLFTSGAAAVLFLVAEIVTRDACIALLAATLYLLNFAVSNLFLIGFVDSGEAFFLLLITWALLAGKWWTLPPAMILGTLTKETLLILSTVFAIAWIVGTKPADRLRRLFILSLGAAVALLALLVAFKLTTGNIVSFATNNDLIEPRLTVVVAALKHRALWYVFAYTLVLGTPRLKEMPRAWTWATAMTFVALFALEVLHAGTVDIGPALARPGFSVAGPLLTCSMALFLVRTMSPARSV